MKIKWNNQYVRWGATGFLTIAASILFYYLIFNTANIGIIFAGLYHVLMPVFFGFILAYILSPVLNFIEKKFLNKIFIKIKFKNEKNRRSFTRKVSVTLTTVLFFLLIYMMIRMMISQIVPSIQKIIENYDVYEETVVNWVNNFMNDENEFKTTVMGLVDTYSGNIEEFLSGYDFNVVTKATDIVKTLSASLFGIFKVLWNFVIGFIISFYLLSNKEKFAVQGKKFLYAFLDKDSANVFLNNLRFTHNTFIGFIGGKLVDSLIIGLICFIVTTIMSTPYAALVSLIIGLTNIIPFFGPFLGAIPSGILILIVDPLHPLNCLYFLIFVVILQQVDGNIIGPKILGDSTGLSSFWVIFAITFFGGIFGVFGMIIGVPLFAVIYAALRSFINGALIKKSLPIEESVYEHIECIDDAGIHEYNSDERMKYINEINKTKAQHHEVHNAEIISGMKYMSGAEEWVRRVPVKWDDAQTRTSTIISFKQNESNSVEHKDINDSSESK